MKRNAWITVFALSAAAALSVAIAVAIGRARRSRDEGADRETCRAWLLQKIHWFHRSFDRLPNDWNEFQAAGHSMTGEDLLGMVSQAKDGVVRATVWIVQAEEFPKALAEAQCAVSRWKLEQAVDRERLAALRGDLAAQLRLFVQPSFHPENCAQFVTDLHDVHCVHEKTLSLFMDTANDLRRAERPERGASQDERRAAERRFQEISDEIVKTARARGRWSAGEN